MAYPAHVANRRTVEAAIDAELDWDLEKIGIVAGFLGELPCTQPSGMTTDEVFQILSKIYEDLKGK